MTNISNSHTHLLSYLTPLSLLSLLSSPYRHRTYVAFDIIHRVLTSVFGFDVHLVMGITDIDDKIITRAQERGIAPQDLAPQFEQSFMRDMQSLNVLPPSTYVRVTDHMQEIIDYISALERRGYTYTVEGSVYFDTMKFHEFVPYGALGIETMSKAMAADRDDESQNSFKRNPADFALWKIAKDGELAWKSPWSDGRPGWHIECSAMSNTVLGSRFDIHTGGVDLKFPHHTNEIAQSCAFANDSRWVRYFMHSGHLHIEGHKMSKSLKNFITIEDFLSEFDPDHFRMFCLLHPYRANIDFSRDRMVDASNVLRRLLDFVSGIRVLQDQAVAGRKWMDADRHLFNLISTTRSDIATALCNDFDTPAAIKSMLDLVSASNRYIA
jgi:cysteinyl-tRNA synthetase